ncbi:hypothetical protein V1525DRAFT_345033, partial [Lipomyces kononenkoae]
KSKLNQRIRMPWLPASIDSQELVPRDFGPDDWKDQTSRAFHEFFSFGVVDWTTVQGIPDNTALGFEPFAIFDRSWTRACWAALEDDFRDQLVAEFQGISRQKVTYLGIWLLAPWVLGSIIYNLWGIAPGSREFAAMEDGFSRGDLARVSFKFSDEFADCGPLVSAVAVQPPVLPLSFWGRRRMSQFFQS